MVKSTTVNKFSTVQGNYHDVTAVSELSPASCAALHTSVASSKLKTYYFFVPAIINDKEAKEISCSVEYCRLNNTQKIYLLIN